MKQLKENDGLTIQEDVPFPALLLMEIVTLVGDVVEMSLQTDYSLLTSMQR
jgi:hypothetical protein